MTTSHDTAELLCKLCDWLTARGLMTAGVQQRLPDVWAWWLERKEADQEKQRQRAARRLKDIELVAVAEKLTERELELTGVVFRNMVLEARSRLREDEK